MFNSVAKRVREHLIGVLPHDGIDFRRINNICCCVVRGIVEGLPGLFTRTEDIQLPLATAKLLGYSDPAFTQICNDGNGSTGIFAYSFSYTHLNEIFITTKLPKNYIDGSDIKVFVHIYPETVENGEIIFDIERVLCNVDDDLGNSHVQQCSYDIEENSQKKHLKIEMCTISGTGLRKDAGVGLRIARRGDLPADTHNGAVWITRMTLETKALAF